jgi:hypothetical protein
MPDRGPVPPVAPPAKGMQASRKSGSSSAASQGCHSTHSSGGSGSSASAAAPGRHSSNTAAAPAPAPSVRRRGSTMLPRLLAALLAAALALPPAAGRAADVRFESKPIQINLPWTVGYTWGPPAKQVWPQALSYTATESGTMYFTVTATRTGTVRTGSLQGALSVQRGSGEESGGSDQPLVANQPQVELWQAVGPATSAPVRLAAATCIWDGAGATFTMQTPGTSARCTYTFNGQFSYDPEQPAELRVPQLTFTNFGPVSGLPPYPLEAYGPTTTPGRCAQVRAWVEYCGRCQLQYIPRPHSCMHPIHAPYIRPKPHAPTDFASTYPSVPPRPPHR